MSREWDYPEEIERLCGTIKAYHNGEIDLESLQDVLTNSAQNIVAYEERDLREELIRAEAELETIRFTVDEDSVRDAALKVIAGLETTLDCEDD